MYGHNNAGSRPSSRGRFTARVSATPANQSKPQRQDVFVVIPTSIFRVRETSIGLAVLEELTNAIGYECFAGAVQETLDGL